MKRSIRPRNPVVLAAIRRSGAGAGTHAKSRKADRLRSKQALRKEVW